MSLEYSQKIQGWAIRQGRRFRKYKRECAELYALAGSGKATDSSLKYHAKGLEAAINRDVGVTDSNDEYHMYPHVYKNHIVYTDMNGHGKLFMYRTPEGYWAIKGTRNMIGLVGGRGELSTFIQNFDDGDFFHSRSKYQSASPAVRGYKKAA